MRLDDPELDRTASETRDALLLGALRCQIAFMRAKVPFWRERLRRAHESLLNSSRKVEP